MPFTPIDTQEAFDQAVAERLSAREAEIRGEYADYETLKTQVADYQTQVETLTREKNEGIASGIRYKKAYEHKIPMDMADRIRGETEEEIEADATALAKMIGHRGAPSPLKNNEPPVEKDAKRAALKGMLARLKEE